MKKAIFLGIHFVIQSTFKILILVEVILATRPTNKTGSRFIDKNKTQ